MRRAAAGLAGRIGVLRGSAAFGLDLVCSQQSNARQSVIALWSIAYDAVCRLFVRASENRELKATLRTDHLSVSPNYAKQKRPSGPVGAAGLSG